MHDVLVGNEPDFRSVAMSKRRQLLTTTALQIDALSTELPLAFSFSFRYFTTSSESLSVPQLIFTVLRF